MTLGMLTLYIGIAALALTGLVVFLGKTKNWLLSFLQNFAGAFFIVSGWVKAVDPLGTGYKLEQYFAEFEATFEATSLSFIAPLFPWLMDYVVAFSVFVIVLEIVLGLALILGASRKLSAWAFFLIVLFFTFLTGFTYLTGYVPQEKVVSLQKDGAKEKALISETSDLFGDGWTATDTVEANFFKFSSWMDYNETNMRVTDCGCFGDFIKLKPFNSFMKDIFLLIPALIFLFGYKNMHQLFNKNTRTGIMALSTIGLVVYCFSNYVWDLPHTDFRPFRENVNIQAQKQAEMEAEQNREIKYLVKELASGKNVELGYTEYISNLDKYGDENQYEFVDQILGEPAIAHTKISEFDATDFEGNEVGEDLITQEGYAFMIIAYDLHEETFRNTVTVKDTSYVRDSVIVADTVQYVMKIDQITDRQVTTETYEWEPDYLARWTEKVNPVLDQAQEQGAKVFAITKFSTEGMVEDFRHETQSKFPFYIADDILLKTIVRSNPGVVLMKDGTIVKKWHYRKFPNFEKLQAEYLK